MKQLHNSKETHIFPVGNIDYNMVAAADAPITNKQKWRLKFKRLGQDEENPSLGPIDPYLIIIPCDFYQWGYVKDQDDQPPVPQSLRERVPQAIAKVHES